MFLPRVVKPWHVLLEVGYVQFVARKGVDLIFVYKGVKSYIKVNKSWNGIFVSNDIVDVIAF